MKFCNQCGVQIADDMFSCPNCGALCGAGEAVADAASYQNAAPDNSQQQYQQPQYQQPQPQYQQPQQQYQQPYRQQYQQPVAPVIDPSDHTAEFDAKDISDNKVIAMLPYLMGSIGIIVALIAASSSPYVAFHVRQALKITVCSLVAAIAAGVLAITVLVPLAAMVFNCILFVLKIIAFFQICSGKAKEPAIVRNFKFLH